MYFHCSHRRMVEFAGLVIEEGIEPTNYINNVIICDSVLFVIAAYLCSVHWIYIHHMHNCHDCCAISRKLTQSILLAVSCLLIAVSLIMDVTFMVYWKRQQQLASNSSHGADAHCSNSSITRNIEPLLMSMIAVFVTVPVLLHIVTWMRQRVCYRNSFLSHMSNGISRFISKYFLIYIAAVFILVLSLISYCILLSLMLYPWAIHCPLLILSIYPLVKATHFNRTAELRTDRTYVRLIKRVTIATAVCLASDTAVAIYMHHFESPIFWPIAFHFNMLLNLICVNLISMDWKYRLAPWVRSAEAFRRRRERISCVGRDFRCQQ